MRILGHLRRWWIAAAAALAVALPLLAFGGPVAQAQLSNQGIAFSGTASPGGTVTISTNAGVFLANATVTCTTTGSAATGGTITPVVQSFTAGTNGALGATLTVPASAAVGTTLTVSCTGVGGGSASGSTVVATAPPPSIPEADVLVLFGTGLAGLGGYAAVRLRSLRRNLPF
jgi:hypothetical protein